MSMQYPYNNNYYQVPQNTQWPQSGQSYINQKDLSDTRQHTDENCLEPYPPGPSPAGFKWIRIYTHFDWNGHYWERRTVTPHWGLIDELHPCNPHNPPALQPW